MVELAAVTLADDCGDHGIVSPPVAVSRKPTPSAVGAPMPPADICEGCAPYRMACEQTSMQLAVRATGNGSTSVRVKRVELLDHRGTFLADLDARAPMRWNGQSYTAWDQKIAGDQKIAASYLLSSPDWNTLTDGRWSAHTKTFQLRVTLAVGDHDRTVDKQSITPAMLEPPVPT